MNNLQTAILKTAANNGRYRPQSKAALIECQRLTGLGVLEEQDNYPGSYLITEAGEAMADKMTEKV
jgi:hypothetical protein